MVTTGLPPPINGKEAPGRRATWIRFAGVTETEVPPAPMTPPWHDSQPPQFDQLCLRRWRPGGTQAQTDCGSQVLLDRLTRQASRAGDGTLALLDLPATNHFFNLHPVQLPIAHLSTLFLVVEMVANGASGGLMLRGDQLA